MTSRVDRERPRDADPLLHPARELVGELVGRVLEPDELQHLACSRVPLRLRHPLHLEPERDVVEHAPVREEAEVLEHHRDLVPAELPKLGLARGDDVPAGDLDRACGRLDQPHERPDERRLARAREAHDDEHLAGPDLDRDVSHRDDAPGLLAQLAAGKERVGRADEALPLRTEDLPDSLRAYDGRPRPVDPGLGRRDGNRARLAHAASASTRAR